MNDIEKKYKFTLALRKSIQLARNDDNFPSRWPNDAYVKGIEDALSMFEQIFEDIEPQYKPMYSDET